jgi:hypothetical protein
MKKRIIMATCALMLAASLAGAQGTLKHAATGTAPKVDGTVAAGEYAVTSGDATLQTSLSWIGDTLYVAVVGQTTGWVSAGLGSTKMANAIMYIGYVTGDTTQLKVQVGSGHSHADTDSNAPLAFKMTEAGGKTTLEVSLKAAQFIAKDQTKLDMILAFGGSDSFISMHKGKAVASFTLAQ